MHDSLQLHGTVLAATTMAEGLEHAGTARRLVHHVRGRLRTYTPMDMARSRVRHEAQHWWAPWWAALATAAAARRVRWPRRPCIAASFAPSPSTPPCSSTVLEELERCASEVERACKLFEVRLARVRTKVLEEELYLPHALKLGSAALGGGACGRGFEDDEGAVRADAEHVDVEERPQNDSGRDGRRDGRRRATCAVISAASAANGAANADIASAASASFAIAAVVAKLIEPLQMGTTGGWGGAGMELEEHRAACARGRLLYGGEARVRADEADLDATAHLRAAAARAPASCTTIAAARQRTHDRHRQRSA